MSDESKRIVVATAGVLLWGLLAVLVAGCSEVKVDCPKGTVSISGFRGGDDSRTVAQALAACPR
jgi:hypothetical protein